MLLSFGGGGFLANVNNTDREFDEKHVAELKGDLKKAGAAATEKLELQARVDGRRGTRHRADPEIVAMVRAKLEPSVQAMRDDVARLP